MTKFTILSQLTFSSNYQDHLSSVSGLNKCFSGLSTIQVHHRNPPFPVPEIHLPTLALDNEIKLLVAQRAFHLSFFDISNIPAFTIIPSQIMFGILMNADGSANRYKT